jgi:hypothetical protein
MPNRHRNVPHIGMLCAGLGAALGGSVHVSLFGSDVSVVLGGAGAFVGYYAGRAIDGLIRKHEIASQQEVARFGRAVFGVLGLLCFVATVANLRWFAHGGGPEALSAAAMTASATAGLFAFASAPILTIHPAMLYLGLFNAGLAGLSLYLLAEKPSPVSIVTAVWCTVVATLLLLTHSSVLKTLLRPWDQGA